jgi:hypothetical protein
MNDLVSRLSEGEHPVHISIRPEATVEAFQECVSRGYVLVKFPNTRGGTELGFKIDKELSDLSKADFTNKHGSIRLVGRLTLDYVKVCCVANIDLTTLHGLGHLERV